MYEGGCIMPYLYDTHVHTSQGSACGRATGAQQARYYKALGFQGIIMTDHFFGGNTAVPRDLPWEERIHRFCSGYEDAYAEGQKIGLDVFFGWEQAFAGDEYLVFGLDKAWLLAHPKMEHWTRRQQLEEVHRHGGCVIQAHPFRNRDYIHHIRLARQFADGIEVANVGNHAYNDLAALRYAREFDLLTIAGSDNHHAAQGSEVFGIALDQPLRSIRDLVEIILTRKPIGLHVPQDRFLPPPDAPALETFWLDDQEQLIPTGRDWLHEPLA